MGISADAYARQLKALLPPGLVWNVESGSTIEKLLLGIADELARIDARGGVLIDESDPRSTSETLPDWERVLGIAQIATLDSDRQAAVAAQYIARGGQTAAYMSALAGSLGYANTIAGSGFEFSAIAHSGSGSLNSIFRPTGSPSAPWDVVIDVVAGGAPGVVTVRVSVDGGVTWGSTVSITDGSQSIDDMGISETTGIFIDVDGDAVFFDDDRWSFSVLAPPPTHVWRMNVDLAASSGPYTLRTSTFRAGASRSGDRLRNWSIPELEAEINRAKPAHTRALFAYTG